MIHYPTNPRPSTLVIAATAAVLCIVITTHIWALQLERRARDSSRPVSERLVAAEQAARLEPLNRHFVATVAIARAEKYLADGRVDEAYFVLLPLSTTVRGDALFTSTYLKTLALKIPIDARKAHQQHAKEKAGGVLDPEDVER